MNRSGFVCVIVGLCALLNGCAEPASTVGIPTALVNSTYLAKAEPAESMPVGEARDSAEEGQEIAVVGVIGGTREPFLDGLAVFTIVDPAVPYCAAKEGCPTPWDYCCTQNQVKENIATVKLVDAAGELVEENAKDLLGVSELATIVAEGVAERDQQGNLTLMASKVFIRK